MFIVLLAFAAAMNVGAIAEMLELNKWLDTSSTDGGHSYTFLILTGLLFTVSFSLMWLVGHIIAPQRRIYTRLGPRSVRSLFWVAFWNAVNGIAIVYAARYTPVQLQAVFLALLPLFTIASTVVLMSGARSYRTRSRRLLSLYPVLAVTILLAGTLLSAVYRAHFQNDPRGDVHKNPGWWAIFAFGLLPGAVYNVLQGRFLREHGFDVADPDTRRSRKELFLAMSLVLALQSLFMTIIFLALFSVDLIPGFGEHTKHGVAGVFAALRDGILCLSRCPSNGAHFAGFSLGYLVTYFSSLYLNVHSPNWCSIVAQLTSPLSAIAVLIFPKLDVWKEPSSAADIAVTVASLFMIIISIVIWFLWENEFIGVGMDFRIGGGSSTGLVIAGGGGSNRFVSGLVRDDDLNNDDDDSGGGGGDNDTIDGSGGGSFYGIRSYRRPFGSSTTQAYGTLDSSSRSYVAPPPLATPPPPPPSQFPFRHTMMVGGRVADDKHPVIDGNVDGRPSIFGAPDHALPVSGAVAGDGSGGSHAQQQRHYDQQNPSVNAAGRRPSVRLDPRGSRGPGEAEPLLSPAEGRRNGSNF